MKRILSLLLALIPLLSVASAVPDSIMIKVPVVSADTIWVTIPIAIPDSVWIKAPVAPAPAQTPAMPAQPGAPAQAATPSQPSTPASAATAADTLTETLPSVAAVHPGWKHSWDNSPRLAPTKVRFAWGAEAGSSVDMSGSDMSSIDFNASFGLRYRWINYVGLGAGANIMVSNSCRSYPIFAIFRTDFSNMLKVAFLDVRGGMSLNYLPGNTNQSGAYASLSVGFNLATGRTFRSYITAGCTYVSRRDIEVGERITPYKDLYLASIRLGVAF